MHSHGSSLLPSPEPGSWYKLSEFPGGTLMCPCVLPALTAPVAVLYSLPEREAHYCLWLKETAVRAKLSMSKFLLSHLDGQITLGKLVNFSLYHFSYS